jgi:molybdate transport system substrate-binding protein
VTRRTRGWLALGVTVLVGVAVSGCGKTDPSDSSASKDPSVKEIVQVMVPCGQVGPFSEIEKMYKKQHPEVKLDWVPENMVTIEDKVIDGKAQPDVVLSMGDVELDRIAAKDLLVPGTRLAYADNALAFTVPAKNPGGVAQFADLAKDSVKGITVPDPVKNSVGTHGMEALKGAGLYDKVSKKVLVPQFAADSYESAEKGQTDVAIGYYPCVSEVHVKGAPPAVSKETKMLGLVPASTYKPFSCEGAVIKGSKNPEGGKKLLAFLKTPEAQQSFRNWNFSRELPKTPAPG